MGSSPAGYYGYQPLRCDPLKDAPATEPSGGVVYFGGTPGESDVRALLGLMGVRTDMKDYAAFTAYPDSAEEERYLVQLRIVSRFALWHMFRAIEDSEYDEFPEQDISAGEALWRFILNQQSRWGTHMGSRELSA